jgi:hypothetical protein
VPSRQCLAIERNRQVRRRGRQRMDESKGAGRSFSVPKLHLLSLGLSRTGLSTFLLPPHKSSRTDITAGESLGHWRDDGDVKFAQLLQVSFSERMVPHMGVHRWRHIERFRTQLPRSCGAGLEVDVCTGVSWGDRV